MVKVVTFAGPGDNGKTSTLNLFLDNLLASSKIANTLESIDYCGMPVTKIGTKTVNPDGRYCFELHNGQYIVELFCLSLHGVIISVLGSLIKTFISKQLRSTRLI